LAGTINVAIRNAKSKFNQNSEGGENYTEADEGSFDPFNSRASINKSKKIYVSNESKSNSRNVTGDFDSLDVPTMKGV